jgi:hypothetical protein
LVIPFASATAAEICDLVNGLSAISLLIVRVIITPCSSAALLGARLYERSTGFASRKTNKIELFHSFFGPLFERQNRLRTFRYPIMSASVLGSSH